MACRSRSVTTMAGLDFMPAPRAPFFLVLSHEMMLGGGEGGEANRAGLKLAKGLDEGTRVEFFEGLGDAALPGSVGAFVDHAQQPWRTANEVQVNLGVNGAEDRTRVFQNVPVLHLAPIGHGRMLLKIL